MTSFSWLNVSRSYIRFSKISELETSSSRASTSDISSDSLQKKFKTWILTLTEWDEIKSLLWQCTGGYQSIRKQAGRQDESRGWSNPFEHSPLQTSEEH